MPATGGVIPSQQITTVKLLKYNNPEDYVLMATEFIFIIYILYYVVEESIEIRMHGFTYFTNIWNILDICVIGVSIPQQFNQCLMKNLSFINHINTLDIHGPNWFKCL